jgi:outer membrane protein OmpA-like peptidoglycan-associated protein
LLHYEKHTVISTDLVRKARAKNVRIVVVSFGYGVNDELLQQVAEKTDGNYYHILDKDLLHVFKELPHIMRNYYTISYKPTVADGGHNLELVYGNNRGQKLKTGKHMHIGKVPELDERKVPENTYWYAIKNGKKPVGRPQAVAFFDFDSYQIDAKYKEHLLKYVGYLEKNKHTTVSIYGHTDSKGTMQYCRELSEKRANAVQAFLLGQGISGERIETHAMGKMHPVWAVEDTEWKARENRRIEIVMYK